MSTASGPKTTSTQDSATNANIRATKNACARSIFSITTIPDCSHRLLALIKTTILKEADTSLDSVSNPQYFIMLYIEDLLDKIKSIIEENLIYSSSNMMDETPCCDLFPLI